MADDKIYTLSEASIRKLAEDHRRLEGMVQNLRAASHQPFAGRQSPELYTGTTATNADNPTYPDSPANTFVVRLSDVKFDESVGEQSVRKEASGLYVIARTHDGSYVAEGTEVLLEKRTSRSGPRWWIVTATSAIAFIELTSKLPLGGQATAKLLEWQDETQEYEMVGDEVIVRDFHKDADGLHNPGDLIGAPGYRGWAKRPTQETIGGDPAWTLIRLEQVAEIIRFTLNTAMSGGSSANATVNAWWDGRSPGTYQTIYDPLGLFAGAPGGAVGIARRNNRTGDGSPANSDLPDGRYEVVECSSNAGVVFFTLTQARSYISAPEESRTALRNHHCGSQQDTISPGNVAVWFREGMFPHALSGAKGVAVYDVTENRYWVIHCDQMAKTIRGTLYQDFCPPGHATANAFTVTDFHPHSQTPDAAHIGAGPTYTLYNYGNFAGLTGDKWEAQWDDSRSKFVLTWVDTHQVDVVIDWQMSSGDCPSLQLKKRTIYAHTCQDAALTSWEDCDWQPYPLDIHSEVSNAYTAASGGDPATCKLKQAYRRLLVLGECADAPAAVDVFSWVSQDVMVNAYDGTSEITGVTQAIWVGPCTMPSTEEFQIIVIDDCPT